MNNAKAERPKASGHRTRLHDSFKNLFSLLFSAHIYNIAAHLQSIEWKKIKLPMYSEQRKACHKR